MQGVIRWLDQARTHFESSTFSFAAAMSCQCYKHLYSVCQYLLLIAGPRRGLPMATSFRTSCPSVEVAQMHAFRSRIPKFFPHKLSIQGFITLGEGFNELSIHKMIDAVGPKLLENLAYCIYLLSYCKHASISLFPVGIVESMWKWAMMVGSSSTLMKVWVTFCT